MQGSDKRRRTRRTRWWDRWRRWRWSWVSVVWLTRSVYIMVGHRCGCPVAKVYTPWSCRHSQSTQASRRRAAQASRSRSVRRPSAASCQRRCHTVAESTQADFSCHANDVGTVRVTVSVEAVIGVSGVVDPHTLNPGHRSRKHQTVATDTEHQTHLISNAYESIRQTVATDTEPQTDHT